MSLQKPLCWICECPTADGAVQAVLVDKDKLQAWALNVCGHEFAEQIEDHDLICFFCVWHAQTLAENDFEDEDLVWWPQNYLSDDAANLLSRSFFEGKIEQCWVQLEKIELPEIEEEAEQQQEILNSTDEGGGEKFLKECIYCWKSYKRESDLICHVMNVHKNAISCDSNKCAAYFHTEEEREKHTLEVHEKPKKPKIIKCNFCDKQISSASNFRQHVRYIHKEFPIRCALRGCYSYFQTEAEMKLHLNSNHRQEIDEMKYRCEYCDYRTQYASHLSSHVAGKHLSEETKCDQCDKMLSSRKAMQDHKRKKHMFKPCILCKTDVPVGYKSWHSRVRRCVHCKNKFDCKGLLKEHLKTCKNTTMIKCEKCAKSFKWRRSLQRHMKTKHRMKLWSRVEHQKLGFKCESCKRYYKSAARLEIHLKYKHSDANLKKCAHCDASFRHFLPLKHHLAVKHGLIEGDFKCDECKKKFVSKCFLRMHITRIH